MSLFKKLKQLLQSGDASQNKQPVKLPENKLEDPVWGLCAVITYSRLVTVAIKEGLEVEDVKKNFKQKDFDAFTDRCYFSLVDTFGQERVELIVELANSGIFEEFNTALLKAQEEAVPTLKAYSSKSDNVVKLH